MDCLDSERIKIESEGSSQRFELFWSLYLPHTGLIAGYSRVDICLAR